jgi:hypothetical protein
MTERSYMTRLINNTKKVLRVFEIDSVLVEIQPGQDFLIESRNPATTYARWESVKFHQDGSVSFVTRPDFTEPDRGRWTIKLLNRDGHDGQPNPSGRDVQVETRVVGGRSVILPKGIPVLVGLLLDDPLIKYKSLTVVKKRVPIKDPGHEGYLLSETILADDLELRDSSELKVLEKLLTEK